METKNWSWRRLPIATLAVLDTSQMDYVYKSRGNFACHGDHIDLVTSSMIRGTSFGEISRLGMVDP
jgi:hypothetical protein